MNSFLDQITFSSFIDGAMSSSNEAEHEHPCFVTKEPWKRVQNAEASDVKKALASSIVAFNKLKKLTVYERNEFLLLTAHILLQNQAAFAEIITKEMGKPLQEALSEVSYTASYFSYFAREITRLYGLSIPTSQPSKTILYKL